MDASDRRRRAAAEAAEWWVSLQGNFSRGQREQYIDWLRESSLHVSELLRVAQVHGALEQFERWAQLPTDGPGATAQTVIQLPTPEARERSAFTSQPRKPARVRFVTSLAAVLLISVMLGTLFYMTLGGQTIQTERGERRVVALADGSLVQVDPETLLRVKYESRARILLLERGRALFHVAKDPDRPFLVHVRATTVRAVGTAFAVERDAKAVVVTVAEGKVAVSPAESPSEADRSSDRHPGMSARPDLHADSSITQLHGPILLSANEQVTVNAAGAAQPIQQVDSGRALAWAEGRLIFQHEPLSGVISQFNRYNRIQLHVSDSGLARRPVSGVFNAGDPESFVAFIQLVTPVSVTRNDVSDITIDVRR